MMPKLGRVTFVTGLSSFGSSLLRSLAGSRFNPSRAIVAEPFTCCGFVTFITLVHHNGDKAELWTIPIVLAGYVATALADKLWQGRKQ